MRRLILGLAAAVTLSAGASSANASWLSHLFAPHRPPQPACVIINAPSPRGGHAPGGYGPGGFSSGHHVHAPAPWNYPARPQRPVAQTFAPAYGNYRPAYGSGVRY